MKYDILGKDLFETLGKLSPPDSNEINRGEIRILFFLLSKENITAGMLSDELKVSTARIAKVLKNLEKKNFIIREKNDVDKRKIKVLITKKGTLFANYKKEIAITNLSKLLEKLGENDAKEFIRIINKIICLNKEEKC